MTTLFDDDVLKPKTAPARRSAGARDEPAESAADSFVDVAIPVPLRHAFTYRVPEALQGRVVRGARVAVPFAGRPVPGFVLRENAPRPERRTKAIASVVDAEPIFTSELLDLLTATADYYLAPIGEVLRAAAPPLPAEALDELVESGFIGSARDVRGKRTRTPRETVATWTADASALAGVKLGASQKVVAEAFLRERELSMTALRTLCRSPKAVLKAFGARGWITTEEREVVDALRKPVVARDVAPPLSAEQRAATERIRAALDGAPTAFLLQGVTGSGKTEVYLDAIESTLERGKSAILVVPEIALTPQLVGRVRARLGDSIALLHSGLTDRERAEAWRAVRSGRLRVVVGARSAIFAPVTALGLVIVDEEHDASFKQEDGVRYHARDLAILRAHRAKAVAILGSATPSLESRRLAEIGKLERLVLASRPLGQPLPAVEIVDLRRHRGTPGAHPLLTAPLLSALRACVDAKEQAILFLNRRGFSPTMRCDDCGKVVECPSCSVPLTFHRGDRALRCHYCDYATRSGDACPACGALALSAIGAGTERIAEAVSEAVPGARVGRLDRDTGAGAKSERVLDSFRRRDVDVLVGTQMVTKGHDIASVTLVGVLLADQSLVFPDFRAGERTFQLLAQVAGRAGRGERPGRVLLQTYQPEHPAVTLAMRHDYEAFYTGECETRRELSYPPFGRLAVVRIDATDDSLARRTAETLADIARSVAGNDVGILGPAAAPIERLRNRYRYRFFLKANERPPLRRVADAVLRRIEAGLGSARASVDVDPISML